MGVDVRKEKIGIRKKGKEYGRRWIKNRKQREFVVKKWKERRYEERENKGNMQSRRGNEYKGEDVRRTEDRGDA